MKIHLIFENTQDNIPFEVKYNHKLIEYFVKLAEEKNTNLFSDDGYVDQNCNKLLTEIHWALGKTNEILPILIGKNFTQNDNILEYLDQKFLNKQHEDWVFSQENIINIDELRFSKNTNQARLGSNLHEQYPDNIRNIKLAEAMEKLGYIFPYEEVNLTVHRLESFFSRDIEYKSAHKWDVFDNPYKYDFESNNDIVNFSFAYTYVGRQYYDKWKNYDTNLECKDHYNYETLEWAFQINLAQPETIPHSQEFLHWCEQNGVRPLTTQIPVANIVDLRENLHYYRKILYNNSRQRNSARLKII